MSIIIGVDDFVKDVREHDDVLIVDADGVLLDFFNSYFNFMKKIGYGVDVGRGGYLEEVCVFPNGDSILESVGGDRKKAHVRVSNILDVFFSSYSHASNMPIIEGALGSLDRLRQRFKVVCVTNMPSGFTRQRADNFNAVGLGWLNIIGNSGSKKHIYEEIRKHTDGVIVNIDDMAENVIDSIETNASELSNGVLFAGGYTCHEWENIYESSRLSVAHSWKDVEEMVDYYAKRHGVFRECAAASGISIEGFLEKHRGYVGYPNEKESSDTATNILKKIKAKGVPI